MGKKQPEKLDLLQGTLDMMVLRTLSAGQANGYEIAKAIEHLSDDVLTVDHGSLYPALHRLEKAAWSPRNGKSPPPTAAPVSTVSLPLAASGLL